MTSHISVSSTASSAQQTWSPEFSASLSDVNAKDDPVIFDVLKNQAR